MFQREWAAVYVIATSFVFAGRLAVPGHDLSLVGTLGALGFMASGFLFGIHVTRPEGYPPAAQELKDSVNLSLVVYALSIGWMLLWMPAGPSVEYNAYEALAYVWAGLTFAMTLLWRDWRRYAAGVCLSALTAFEAWMFMNRGGP